MNVIITDTRVSVTLSRRNLRQLQGILEHPEHLDRCLARNDERGRSLVVQVEEDPDHYQGRPSAQPRRPQSET